MEISINNNKYFAIFFCDRLMHRHNIESTALLNPETQHTIVINRYKKDDHFVKEMFQYMLKLNDKGLNDRSGFTVQVELFRRQELARLS